MKYRDSFPQKLAIRGPEWEYLARQVDAGHARLEAALWMGRNAARCRVSRWRQWSASMPREWRGCGIPRDGALLHEFQAHQGEGRALVFSPDGSRLYSGGQDREIKVFDTRSWEIVCSYADAHPRTIYALALNKDGSPAPSGARDDGGICLWNASDLSVKLQIASPLGTYGHWLFTRRARDSLRPQTGRALPLERERRPLDRAKGTGGRCGFARFGGGRRYFHGICRERQPHGYSATNSEEECHVGH